MSAVPVKPTEAPPELVGPDYNLYQYRHDFYKVVRFRSTAPRMAVISHDKADGFRHDDKLPQALSRARRVCLELALCNEWKWFATFTIASSNYDRKNLDGFYERFSEWLKYQKKKYQLRIPYLLVPEQHGDGSWHMHGFFNSDIDRFLVPLKDLWEAGADIPYKLVRKDYYNWPDYQSKFGFCSFGKIRNHDATAFYATKYISKSFQGDAQRVGLKLYYCSQGLNRAQFLDSVYGPCSALDVCLENHYEFCDTVFLRYDREPGDDPVLDILELQNTRLYKMEPEPFPEAEFLDVVEYYEFTQEVISDFYM
ncbi:MAG: hypothetical protein IJO21_02470 [Oscillospiraceae bacterium]|nr:hypothetical protein [Oscillospiraceae bacterium]